MTLSPLPIDPRHLYAHMGVEALAGHLRTLVACMASAGVEITDTAHVGLDEIDEAVAEHHARHNPAALARHIERVRADARRGLI